ncbi:MAG TPA: threonine--tRNA ligase, partial [Crenotrichaceae bacterium]|nr:threonine--tRNA ligase [Crenotrichaceae bacterium]
QEFCFSDVLVKLSTRPESRVGDDSVWDKAESALEQALNDKQLDWELQPGEGAFYGPKIEFSLRDSIGRVWQCGTIQVDFSMPERLDASYIAGDGSRHTPVMLHRAILGSIERFIGILIEHHAGFFPFWLAPVQAVIIPIAERHADYARVVETLMMEPGFRIKSDLRNEKVGFKIREHSMQRIPYLLILGDKEVEAQTITVRTQKGEDLGVFDIDQLKQYLDSEIQQDGGV